jgi:hypothetical protein
MDNPILHGLIVGGITYGCLYWNTNNTNKYNHKKYKKYGKKYKAMSVNLYVVIFVAFVACFLSYSYQLYNKKVEVIDYGFLKPSYLLENIEPVKQPIPVINNRINEFIKDVVPTDSQSPNVNDLIKIGDMDGGSELPEVMLNIY